VKNREVEQARLSLEEKAEQLALISKYKSEFLANMSHELRTPLNSLLILSDQLSKNPEGNPSSRQTEFSKTIHASGKDLLALINDILDLSKIESGTVVVDVGELRFTDLLDYVQRTFGHVADAKGVDFAIEVDRRVPRSIFTDSKRLQQVIKNLLSNAFKFTDRGRVTLRVDAAPSGWSRGIESLDRAKSVVAFSVTDTGIGIPADKQQIIFEAFQQADGSTSRKYGGTGLGLAISREIGSLLGGEIRLTSTPGEGSSFTLYLPQAYVAPRARPSSDSPDTHIVSVMSDVDAARASSDPPAEAAEVLDDRREISSDDRTLLIVDNDENFVRFLIDMAHEYGFKALVATQGAEALALAQQYRLDAITLDIQLPIIDGWRVLDRLKTNLATRHVPVYVITTEEDTSRGFALGARGVVTKPIKTKETLDDLFSSIGSFLARREKSLLFLWPDPAEHGALAGIVGHDGMRARFVASGAEALGALEERAFDCVVLGVPPSEDVPGETLGEIVRQCEAREIPVLFYVPTPLSPGAKEELERLAHGGRAREVHSPERLLDQTALLLHQPVADLPKEKRNALEAVYSTDRVLAGRKVLIVDDDIRNIFALTSVLERQNMDVLSAETGKDAIAKLKSTEGVDIVLMDIMMPDMDGYDTMRAIRKIGKFHDLPIIAVTAKAMKGDREKTLQAGAWDYLSKPVDTDQMLSVLRNWLLR
ncbi:MAG: response regulator, partial [Acidobacteriota bacterium]|nr:response regulator [Acidobacteriota bacterium]